MKIKYLKDHNGISQGDTGEVDEGIGKYRVAMSVAEEVDSEETDQDDKPKRGRKPKQD